MDQLKEAAQKLKDKISNNPLEKLLNEATSDVNWNASNKILQEIADHTYSFGDFTEVMKFIWKKLGSERKAWRKILKTLTLIEYLIKNGSPKCVQEFQREIYLIRTLQDFSHYEDGQDRGAAIREVSKRVVQLLGDDAKIDEERKKAQEIRERLGNLGAVGSGANKYGGYSNKDSGSGSSSWKASSSSSNYNSSSTGGEVRKTKDWRVQKEETSSRTEEREKEKEEYVEKTGTKYNPSNTREREEQEAKAVEKKKLAPPKNMKAPVVQQQQQEVDFFGMDAPTTQPQPQPTQTSAPANNNNNVFGWEAPQTQPQSQPQTQPQAQPQQPIWDWQQGQQAPAQPTQPTQPVGGQGAFNWNQAPTQPTQPVQPNVQNLYPQQPQPTQGFGFNNAPQQNNMNNLTSQLNQISFNAPSTSGNFNMGGGFNNNQPTQPTQPVNNLAGFNTSPPKASTDGFDDFVTAKSTAPITNEYKNYSQQEKSIIDLSDITNEASQKKSKQDKVEVAKNSNEGFLYSSKDELDNFFVPSQPLNNLTNMGISGSNMTGGFNQGMMNQAMKNMPMGGMQPMGMGGMQQMGMGNMPQMGMGGMQPMGMQPMGNGMMGNMQGMQMGMGFQNMGMNANAGFNNMGMNMQGGYNQNMNQGFGYR